MKKLFITFFLVLVSFVFCQAQWKSLGVNDLTQLSFGSVVNSLIDVDGNGTPYVEYREYINGTIGVKKYTNAGWQMLGDTTTFTSPSITVLDFKVDKKNNVPFVLYTDFSSHKLSVKKFNGTSWVQVGSAQFSSANNSLYAGMAIDNTGNPNVYYDTQGGESIIVMKFNGSSWGQLGGNVYNGTFTSIPDIAIGPDGLPYVSYGYDPGTYQMVVKKYDGTNWTQIGADITVTPTHSTYVNIDGSGIPYASCIDISNKVNVFKYNSGNWNLVGATFLGQEPVKMHFDQNNLPYIMGSLDSSKYGIKKFNGTAWINADGKNASRVNINDFTLDANGIPYVTFADDSNQDRCNVKKYDGSNWITVGNVDSFYAANSSNLRLAADGNGILYMMYADASDSNKATVRKYTGGEWQLVGQQGFSLGPISYNGMLFDKDNTPFVYYSDNGIPCVMKFDGTNWTYVGQKGLSNTTGEVSNLSVTINKVTGSLWAAYDNGEIEVSKFDGTNWVMLGNLQELPYYYSVNNPSVVVSSTDTPYVWNNEIPVIGKYNGKHWVQLPNTLSTSNFSDVIMSGNDTLFAFWGTDAEHIGVAKYNGTTLQTVAPQYSLTGDISDFLLDNSNSPYVLSPNLYPYAFNVLKFNGSNWIKPCDSIFILTKYQSTDFTLMNGKIVIGYTNSSGVFAKYFDCTNQAIATATAGTGATLSQFTAHWNAVAGASGYFLDVSLHSNFSSFLAGYNNLNAGYVTSYTVTGLTPGLTYYYRVRLINSCGVSANSNAIALTTGPCPALAGGTVTPASVIICSGTTQLLTLNGASGGTQQWQISVDNVNWTNVNSNGNGNAYTTLAGDGTTKKYYRCLSSSACITSSSTSAIVDVSSPTITVSASGITDKSITLNWSPAGQGNYAVSYSGGTNGLVTSITPPYTLSGLTSGSSYSVTVTQTSPSGCPAKGTLTGITSLCTAPTALHVTTTTTNSLSIAWTGPAGNYRVYYTQLFSSSVATLTQDVTNVASATISSLLPGATYKIYVARKDCPSMGNIGQPSAFIYGATTNTTTCATPVIDLVSSTCSGQIQVTLHGSASGQYRIYMQQLTPVLQPANSYAITGGNFSINVVGAGQTYLVAAASVCGSSVSNLTEWVQGIAVPATCNGVSNLLLSQPTCEGFTASWNADNCTSNTLSSYALYVRKQGAISWTAIGVPSVSLFKTVNTLLPGNTYQSFVRSAYTCNGYIVYGPASATQTITTLSSGCRLEDETTTTDEPSPAVLTNSNESFSLYPNPNAGEFTIALSQLNTEEENVRVEVLNMIGQTELTHLTTISNGHLNEFIYLPNGTASGMYFVRVTAGKNVYTSKVNINK